MAEYHKLLTEDVENYMLNAGIPSEIFIKVEVYVELVNELCPELEDEWRHNTRLRIHGIPMTPSNDIEQFWEFA